MALQNGTSAILPSGTRDIFTNALIPLLKIKAGTLEPWAGISSEHVQELVNTVFPEANHVVVDNDVWCGLVRHDSSLFFSLILLLF